MTHRVAGARTVGRRRHRRTAATRIFEVVADRYLALPLGVLCALFWANASPEPYFVVAQRLAFAVNDIGMTLFIGLLMQEIVEAVMPAGALHPWGPGRLPPPAAGGGGAGKGGGRFAKPTAQHPTRLSLAYPPLLSKKKSIGSFVYVTG